MRITKRDLGKLRAALEERTPAPPVDADTLAVRVERHIEHMRIDPIGWAAECEAWEAALSSAERAACEALSARIGRLSFEPEHCFNPETPQ